METLQDRCIAITGAAHGIGEQLALEAARRGADLALCDIDPEGLAETAEDASARGSRVHRQIVDVAERDGVRRWSEEVAGEFPWVDVLVNNAGVTYWATVDEMRYENFKWLMDVNFWGVVHATNAFLPQLRRADAGRIVNVSSAFGMVASPCLSAYSSAKFAVRGFTHALRSELELQDSPLEVMNVYPGSVATDNVRRGRFDGTGPIGLSREQLLERVEGDLARVEPQKVAREILDGLSEGRGRVVIGFDALLVDLVHRLLPAKYPEPLARIVHARLSHE